MRHVFISKSNPTANSTPSQWKKRFLSGVMAACVASFGLAAPSMAEAKGHHHHKKKHHKHKHCHHVVVVKKKQRHDHYHRSRLPEIATFAVIAGATYAIINNAYYKQRGDNYEYVDKPRR